MLLALCHLIYNLTGNLISLSDLLLPAGEQLHLGQSEPVPLPTEHPDTPPTCVYLLYQFCNKQKYYNCVCFDLPKSFTDVWFGQKIALLRVLSFLHNKPQIYLSSCKV